MIDRSRSPWESGNFARLRFDAWNTRLAKTEGSGRRIFSLAKTRRSIFLPLAVGYYLEKPYLFNSASLIGRWAQLSKEVIRVKHKAIYVRCNSVRWCLKYIKVSRYREEACDRVFSSFCGSIRFWVKKTKLRDLWFTQELEIIFYSYIRHYAVHNCHI